jgi:hypothetical protein
MTGTVAVAVALLADGAPRNTGPDFGKASPVGLLIIVLLMIGTFALIWSMNRHLRKLPQRFNRKQSGDQGHGGPLPGTAGESAPGTVGESAPGTVGESAPGTVGESADSADNPEGSRHDPSG